MATWLEEDAEYISIELLSHDNKWLGVQEVSAFLYDINLLYELALLINDRQYKEFKFTSHIGSSKARWQIKEEDKLYVAKLRIGSPLIQQCLVALTDGTARSVSAFLSSIGTAYKIIPAVTATLVPALIGVAKAKSLLAKERKDTAQAKFLNAKTRGKEIENVEKQESLARLETSRSHANEEGTNQLVSFPVSDRRLKDALRKKGAIREYNRLMTKLRDSHIQLIAVNVTRLNQLPQDHSRNDKR
jgi:hypothetical protein